MEIWQRFRTTNYEVSSLGQVRNLLTKRVLKQQLSKTGYLRICLELEKKYTFTVHRLVAEVFIGEVGEILHVDHINRIRNDNRLENLRIVTREENMKNREFKSRLKLLNLVTIDLVIDLFSSGFTSNEIYKIIYK